MRMSNNIVSHRKLVGTMSAEPLLNLAETNPPTIDKSLQRRKITTCKTSTEPLENSQVNLKRRSHQTSLSVFIHSLFSGKKRGEHIIGSIKERNINASCPNLSNRKIVENKFRLGHELGRDNIKRASSAKKLTSSDVVSIFQPGTQVPNIFITSLTRSRSDDNCRTGSTTVVKKTAVYKSSPVLSEDSSSETNQSDRTSRERDAVTDGDFCQCDFRPSSQRLLYRNENMAQITQYLFVGRAEVANDQRLLCKLDIHSLIDITNSSKNGQNMNLPCPCSSTSFESHFHPKLYVNVEDTETGPIKDHFPVINKFIDGSRKLGRGTLIFSTSGRSRAPAAAIQYLVTRQGMSVNEAYQLLKSQWPDTEINRGFRKCLVQLENRKSNNGNVYYQSIRGMCDLSTRPQVKNAWTEHPM